MEERGGRPWRLGVARIGRVARVEGFVSASDTAETGLRADGSLAYRLGSFAAFALTAGAVVMGLVFRLGTRSDLWLDEALSVNIAALPVGDLLDALRHDGHPPLYYLLLHGWIEVFGDGDSAVRALSGVFGIAALPLFWLAGRRYGSTTDRRSAVAVAAVVLGATSPFAVRYATEARMYSLVMFLVVLGWLAVQAALDRPGLLRLTSVGMIAGLLALTHYWSFYLLAATGVLLVAAWRRGSPAAGRVALGLIGGAVLFLPWLPSFLDQAGSTGTPWGRPERPANILAVTFADFGGGEYGEAKLLGVALVVLVALALFGRAIDGRRVELDLHTRPTARPEAVVVVLTLAVATVAGYATASAFASRYTAVVFPLVILLSALGLSQLGDVRLRTAVLAVLVLLGAVGCVRNVVTDRTQAGQLAAHIEASGASGDVVVFCPDQLGPAVSRLLPEDRRGITYPDRGDPRFVDWVDYVDRMEAGSPNDFAIAVDQLAGDGTVWLVWSDQYRPVEAECVQLVDALRFLRPDGRAVIPSGEQFEHAWLHQFGSR